MGVSNSNTVARAVAKKFSFVPNFRGPQALADLGAPELDAAGELIGGYYDDALGRLTVLIYDYAIVIHEETTDDWVIIEYEDVLGCKLCQKETKQNARTAVIHTPEHHFRVSVSGHQGKARDALAFIGLMGKISLLRATGNLPD
jgi:hypothetical protein